MSSSHRHIGTFIIAAISSSAFGVPQAQGQGRAMHPFPAMQGAAMRPAMPANMTSMTRSTMQSTMGGQTTTPATMPMNLTTNQLLRRDILLDSALLRELRFDRRLAQNYYGNMLMRPGAYGMSGYGSYVSAYASGGYGPSGGAYTTPTQANAPTGPPPAGESSVDTAKAALLREQVIAEQLANRRRTFDELLYERENALTPDRELLIRSRGYPTADEIASGQALNALLSDIRRLSVKIEPVDFPDVRLPVAPEKLKHINVSRGVGNIAVLKNRGQIDWPSALTDAAFQEPRELVATLAAEAVRQASRGSGRVDADIIKQLGGAAGQMHKELRRQERNLSIRSYADAKIFLFNLDEAVIALGQPDAPNHFTGAYDLKSKTVSELVKQMTDNGLRFAPASPGGEVYYAALREALAECDVLAGKATPRRQ